MKSKICNICIATVNQEVFGLSGGGCINTLLSAKNFQPMFTETLQMINNFINKMHTGTTQVQPVNFPGLPEDEQSLTNNKDVHLTNNQQDCYTELVSSAIRIKRRCP